MAYSDLDDVDYLAGDNVMDEFAYLKWQKELLLIQRSLKLFIPA